jgi:hypothetical protein
LSLGVIAGRQFPSLDMTGVSSLHCIAYVSTATSRLATPESLDALLRNARDSNRACGVTGVLLHHGGNFFQYLEGPPEALHRVYARIRQSRGHTGIYELLNRPVRERQFETWTMGFAEPVSSELQRIAQASWTSQLSKAEEQSRRSPGLMLLLDFWTRATHAAR